jgi:hypothetical protein
MRSDLPPFLLSLLLVTACGNGAPTDEVLALTTTLPGPDGEVAVDFRDGRSRGEWWPCDGRLTAQTCVGDAHVNVFLSLPVVDRVEELGSTICVQDGAASGAFEILKNRYDNLADARIPEDVSAIIVVGSDADGDGFVEDVDGETAGAGLVVEGTIELFSLNGFDQPLSLRLTGTVEGGAPIEVTFLGPMSVPAVVPPPEGPETCVAPE